MTDREHYSMCVKYNFSEKNAEYFTYTQFNEYTKEQETYSLDRRMLSLNMSNGVKKDWFLGNLVTDEEDYYVGFKRRYLDPPRFSNIYKFLTEGYKLVEERFTAQNAACEIGRKEYFSIFADKDLINTLEFSLYEDNNEILLFKNEFSFAFQNHDKEKRLVKWSNKEKYIIKHFEELILGYWINRGRSELNATEKEELIEKVRSVNYVDGNFDSKVDYLSEILREILKALKITFIWNKKDLIYEVLEFLLCINESLYISDQTISIYTAREFNGDIYNLLRFVDGLKDVELALNLKVIFRNMSAGELEFVNGFSNLYSAIQIAINNKEIDTLLLLLDEPDASFHPEWSRRYIHNISQFLDSVDYGKDIKYQIIITTHSPFIVSDIPKEHITCINIEEDDSGNAVRIVKKAEFGLMSNFYDIIQSDFFITSPIGEHAKQIFNGIVKRITSWNEYNEEEIASVTGIISSIGEEMIRSKLQVLLNDKKVELLSREEKIKRIHELEREIKKLKNTMDVTNND